MPIVVASKTAPAGNASAQTTTTIKPVVVTEVREAK
jgi:hypothetical protein